MKRTLTVFLFIGFVFFLLGCDAEKKVAIAVPERYFELVQEGKFEELPELYSRSFFQGFPKEALVISMEGVNKALGRLKKYKLLSWSHTKRDRTKGGDKFKFTYLVTYTKDTSSETFTLSNGRSGIYKITDHSFYSKSMRR
jgi:hypothetical protein